MLNLFCVVWALAMGVQAGSDVYPVPLKANPDGQPFDSFVSHSIEFSSFPEFAGMSNRFQCCTVSRMPLTW